MLVEQNSFVSGGSYRLDACLNEGGLRRDGQVEGRGVEAL